MRKWWSISVLVILFGFISLYFFNTKNTTQSLNQKEKAMIQALEGQDLEKIDQFNIDFDSMKTIDCTVKGKKIALSEIIEDAHHFSLEFKEEALFSSVFKVEMTDSVVFVYGFESIGEYVLRAFTRTGEFLYTIGSQGKGPEQYIRLSGFELYNGFIYLFDDARSSLLKYDLSGNFISNQKVPFRFQDMKFINDTSIIFNLAPYNEHIPQIQGYDIVITDTNFIPFKKAFFTDRKNKKMDYGVGNSYFNRYNENIYFHPLFSDTIYSINDKLELKAFAFIDLGEQSLSMNEKNNKSKDFMKILREEDKILLYDNIFVSDKYVLIKIDFCLPERKGIAIFNRENEKTLYFRFHQLTFDTPYLITTASILNVKCNLSNNMFVSSDNCNIEAFDKNVLPHIKSLLNSNTKKTYLRPGDGNEIITIMKYKDEISF